MTTSATSAATSVVPSVPTTPTILVPLDGASLAEQALAPAVQLVKQAGGTLLLLTAAQVYGIDLTWYTLPLSQGENLIPLDEMIAAARRNSEAYLAAQAARLAADGLAVRTMLAPEVPAEAIVRVAQEEAVWLIVLATHGQGGVTRWAFGSVAEKVLQTATVPLLLVRAAAEPLAAQGGTVFVALDGSTAAEAVLADATAIAGLLGARIILGHVVVEPSSPLNNTEPLMEARRHYAQHAEDYLAGVVDRLVGAGVDATAEVLYGDDAASALTDRVSQGGIELVAITTHGHGGLTRLAFGSVADRVLRTVAVPVLLKRIVEDGK